MNLNFSISPYLSKMVLEFVFRSGVLQPLTNLYVALYSSEIDTLTLSGTELSGGGYTRAACGTGTDWWSEPVVLEQDLRNVVSTHNLKPINFPQPTADWGVVRSMALLNTASGAGDMIFYGRTVGSPFELQVTAISTPLVILPGALKLVWA